MRLMLLSTVILLAACGGEPPLPSPSPDVPAETTAGTQGSTAGLELSPARHGECASSMGCAFWGRCTLARSGDCVVGSDDDCRASIFCVNVGRCSRMWDGQRFRCAALNEEDCRQSHSCQEFGVCRLGRDNTCR